MHDRSMSLIETCRICGNTETVRVNTSDYTQWKHGKLIQNVMPYLSLDERELLISGICGRCFNKIYDDEEREWLANA